jgi:hypothetical protein
MANSNVGAVRLDTALVDSFVFARCVAKLSDLRVNHLTSPPPPHIIAIMRLQVAPMSGVERCDLSPQLGTS